LKETFYNDIIYKKSEFMVLHKSKRFATVTPASEVREREREREGERERERERGINSAKLKLTSIFLQVNLYNS
jgi:hypothetical protein